MKKELLLMLIMLGVAQWTHAVTFEDGGLTYLVNDDRVTVQVTYPAEGDYSGDIRIPELATFDNQDFVVTGIGRHAFAGCDSLLSVSIPGTVKTIDRQAFYSCKMLRVIAIPDSVTVLGEKAFALCESLEDVEIGASLKTIVPSDFEGCTSLVRLSVSPGNPWLDSRDHCNAVIETASNTLLMGCKTSRVPETLTAIGPSAFEDCTGLTDIEFPDAMTTMGASAFKGCKALTSITLPASLEAISDYLFMNCSSLQDITIQQAVTSIGASAFYGCAQLQGIQIPPSVTTVRYMAFSGCSSLRSIVFPNSVMTIESNVMQNCSNLVSAVLPDELKVIASGLFLNCKSLVTVNIPTTVERIEWGAFHGCSSLEAMQLPDGLTFIGINAFSHTAIQTIDIPDSVTSLGWNVFENCTSLKQATIGNGVKIIGIETFKGCTGLQQLTLGNAITEIEKDAFNGCYSLEAVSLPNSLKKLGYAAFSNCRSLRSVDLGEGVTSLDYFVFSGCSSLEEIKFPQSLKSINNLAFQGCTNLKNIDFGAIESIGNGVFKNCTSLETITLPATLKGIGSAFRGCSNLRTVHLDAKDCSSGSVQWFDSGTITQLTFGQGVLTVPAGIAMNQTSLDTIVIPSSVKTIGSAAFYGCSQLTDIKFPQGLTAIGDRAVGNCRSLTSVTIPPKVSTMGSGAFWGCVNLTTVNFNAKDCRGLTEQYYVDWWFENSPITWVNIGNNVERIPAKFVKNQPRITSITIPERVKVIESEAFMGCTGIDTVDFRAIHCEGPTHTNDAWFASARLSVLTIGDAVEHIPAYLAVNQSGITSIAIPEATTSIGQYAFTGCSSLSTVYYNAIDCEGIEAGTTVRPWFDTCPVAHLYLGDQVKHIPHYLAYKRTQLDSLFIPASVTTIGDYAFYGCGALKSIETVATVPPTIDDKTFSQETNQTARLTVPEGCVDSYKMAQYWERFFNIGSSGMSSVTAERRVISREYIGMDGVTSPHPLPGINVVITRYDDGTISSTKVMIK